MEKKTMTNGSPPVYLSPHFLTGSASEVRMIFLPLQRDLEAIGDAVLNFLLPIERGIGSGSFAKAARGPTI